MHRLYIRAQQQIKNLKEELKTLELALELKEQSRNGDTWHPGQRFDRKIID